MLLSGRRKHVQLSKSWMRVLCCSSVSGLGRDAEEGFGLTHCVLCCLALCYAVLCCRAWLELQADAEVLQPCGSANPDASAQAIAQEEFLGQAGDSSATEVSTLVAALLIAAQRQLPWRRRLRCAASVPERLLVPPSLPLSLPASPPAFAAWPHCQVPVKASRKPTPPDITLTYCSSPLRLSCLACRSLPTCWRALWTWLPAAATAERPTSSCCVRGWLS